MVFHSTALIGSVWFLGWWFLVFDSPEKHPRISEEERSYILSCLGQTVTTKKKVSWNFAEFCQFTPTEMNEKSWNIYIDNFSKIWSSFVSGEHGQYVLILQVTICFGHDFNSSTQFPLHAHVIFAVIFQLPTPWKNILTSVPLWMNAIAQWGGIWSLFTLMTQAPTYFKQVHGWNMKMVSVKWRQLNHEL